MRIMRVKNFIQLHSLFLLYSFTIVISKCASQYTFLSTQFLFYYGLQLLMIMIYAFFWQKVLGKFSLAIAYSNKGMVMLWTLILSYLLFGEKVTLFNIIGIIIIISGIALVVKDDE